MKQSSHIIVLSFFSLEQEVIKSNCQETLVYPFSRSGIFTLNPNNRGNVSVQCERGEDGKGKACCAYD